MSFLIQRPAGRGYALTQITADALRIGRGTNQELRSENPAVALEHAVIEGDAAGYLITDKGSITGTYVNGKPVESARLSKGDAIEIGDLRIEIQLADPTKPLFLRVITARTAVTAYEEEQGEAQTAPAPAAAGRQVVKAKKIDYANAYRLRRPYFTKLTVTAVLLIGVLAAVGELARPERQKAFMPGGVSSAHARIRDANGEPVADRCSACHTPWRSVTNGKCMECHPHDVHAQFEKDPPDCYTCHAEHRGATRLAEIGDERCTGCHQDLGAHVRVQGAELASARFGGRYTFGEIAKIPFFGRQHPDFRYPRDESTLRFDHQLHLASRGIVNAGGTRQVLACDSCHDMKDGEPAPVDFEQHCQSCHVLSFDVRFPDVQVPHGGDAGTVYGFVMSYSADPRVAERSPEEIRRIIASGTRVAPDARAAANAEHVIKTKCRLCHEIKPRGERLAVTPPVQRAQWLSKGTFTHVPMQHRQCEGCHRVRESADTADVLMPRRDACVPCHAANASATNPASKCLTCHEYHHRPKKASDSERGG
jgi:predicted CXXCH cytochrome family protein